MTAELDRNLSGVPGDLLQPHIILPSQHFGDRKSLLPEIRLMVAVVEDAINCAEKYRAATDRRSRRLFGEVMQWFSAQESDWPYSFESICDVLRLDANAVRQRLGVTPAQPPAWASSRMHAARQTVQAAHPQCSPLTRSGDLNPRPPSPNQEGASS